MHINKKISRRDFLKLSSIVPLFWVEKPIVRLSNQISQNSPNIIIFVLDAWSARHLRLYGYPRYTMPNLEKFTENTTIYHRHYSAGTFTTPGTASLLSGLYPWSHRAFSLGSSGIIKAHKTHQAFAAFANTHSILGYAQNKYADAFLNQSASYLDTHISSGAFALEHRYFYNSPAFSRDANIAFAGIENNIFQDGVGYDASLFLGPIYRLWKLRERTIYTSLLADTYPRGVPDSTEQFLLSDLIDGTIKILQDLQEPSFAYFHFHPPHGPYRPTNRFFNTFNKGWKSKKKPIHRLSLEKNPYGQLIKQEQYYDEYLLSWDEELGRLFDYLKESGLIDRSYIVITSDHGELFERGEQGHFTPLIYDPLIHIPLIVSSPDGKKREDIYAPTNSVDILPTLATLAGKKNPHWVEGEVLPGFGGIADFSRSIFVMDAKENSSFKSLTKGSFSLTKNNRRLTYYNYPGDQQFEYYDLDEDPEELINLIPKLPVEARHMKDELLQKLSDVNSKMLNIAVLDD